MFGLSRRFFVRVESCDKLVQQSSVRIFSPVTPSHPPAPLLKHLVEDSPHQHHLLHRVLAAHEKAETARSPGSYEDIVDLNIRSGVDRVDRAGPERTEAGESAPSRLEDSPRPGRAKCELCETLQDLIMGAGEEASLNLPCLLILASSWIARPSHSYSSELQATRGTLCCAAILPF